MTSDVTIGSLWRHHNGIYYTVYDITNEHSENPSYPVMVSYVGPNARRWSRPLNDWHRSMTKEKSRE